MKSNDYWGCGIYIVIVVAGAVSTAICNHGKEIWDNREWLCLTIIVLIVLFHIKMIKTKNKEIQQLNNDITGNDQKKRLLQSENKDKDQKIGNLEYVIIQLKRDVEIEKKFCNDVKNRIESIIKKDVERVSVLKSNILHQEYGWNWINFDPWKLSKDKNWIDVLESCFEEKNILFFYIINRKDKIYQSIVEAKYPFLKMSSFVSDFMLLEYDLSLKYLQEKKKPALDEARRIKELRGQTNIYVEQYKAMQYKYEALFQLFPELVNYVDDIDVLKNLDKYQTIANFEDDYDRVKNWIPKEEYEKLDENVRNQLALDRYINGNKKSNWQIGRDYELYCGYMYRKNGWRVEQFGVEKKLNDMGRDIIALNSQGKTHVIQCKYWAQGKLIHEKHIAQLYGSTIEYSMYLNLFADVVPVFITNVELSETAERFAKKLGVLVYRFQLHDFPRIKCNINNGNKIYHLPFDQQYDRAVIKDEGEFYAWTVEEAVNAGFRRAFRFHG